MATLNNVEEDLVTKHVSQWIDLNEQIKNYQAQITELKSGLKIVESEIIRSMKDNQLTNFELAGGKELKLKVVESKKSLTPKWFKNELIKCNSPNNSKEQVLALVKELYTKIDNRPSKKTEKLQYVE
tara:strand:+ start:1329 stop:1709 length:381 start_codon:yes stop_codon:yes gene_type:complete